MKELEKAKQDILIDYARHFGTKVFVETGTYKGDTVKAMLEAKLYDEIHTIDIYQDRVDNSEKRFRSFPHIHCWWGDSAAVLPMMLRDIHQPTLFWLDAHHSGKQIARKRGLIETPILAELATILEHDLAADHVIIIDDADYYEVFAKRYDNYPATEELEQMVRAKFPEWVFEVKDNIIRTHRKW